MSADKAKEHAKAKAWSRGEDWDALPWHIRRYVELLKAREIIVDSIPRGITARGI